MKTGVIKVLLKQFDMAEANINEADFDPELHEKVGEEKQPAKRGRKKVEEADE